MSLFYVRELLKINNSSDRLERDMKKYIFLFFIAASCNPPSSSSSSTISSAKKSSSAPNPSVGYSTPSNTGGSITPSSSCMIPLQIQGQPITTLVNSCSYYGCNNLDTLATDFKSSQTITNRDCGDSLFSYYEDVIGSSTGYSCVAYINQAIESMLASKNLSTQLNQCKTAPVKSVSVAKDSYLRNVKDYLYVWGLLDGTAPGVAGINRLGTIQPSQIGNLNNALQVKLNSLIPVTPTSGFTTEDYSSVFLSVSNRFINLINNGGQNNVVCSNNYFVKLSGFNDCVPKVPVCLDSGGSSGPAYFPLDYVGTQYQTRKYWYQGNFATSSSLSALPLRVFDGDGLYDTYKFDAYRGLDLKCIKQSNVNFVSGSDPFYASGLTTMESPRPVLVQNTGTIQEALLSEFNTSLPAGFTSSNICSSSSAPATDQARWIYNPIDFKNFANSLSQDSYFLAVRDKILDGGSTSGTIQMTSSYDNETGLLNSTKNLLKLFTYFPSAEPLTSTNHTWNYQGRFLNALCKGGKLLALAPQEIEFNIQSYKPRQNMNGTKSGPVQTISVRISPALKQLPTLENGVLNSNKYLYKKSGSDYVYATLADGTDPDLIRPYPNNQNLDLIACNFDGLFSETTSSFLSAPATKFGVSIASRSEVPSSDSGGTYINFGDLMGPEHIKLGNLDAFCHTIKSPTSDLSTGAQVQFIALMTMHQGIASLKSPYRVPQSTTDFTSHFKQVLSLINLKLISN